MDRDEFEVRERCDNWRRLPVPARTQPRPEGVHEFWHVSGHGCAEYQPTFGIGDPVLSAPIFAGLKHRIDIVEYSFVDLTNQPFINVDTTSARHSIREGKCLTGGEHFEDVFLSKAG